MSFLAATKAAAYNQQTRLDYNGQLFGFTTSWKEPWDVDSDSYCDSWVYDPEYEEYYCERWIMYVNFVETRGWLWGPGGLYAYGEAEDRWQAGFDVNAFTPDGPGTWHLDGNHYQKEYLYEDSGFGWEPVGANEYLYAQTSAIVTITCGDALLDQLIAEYRTYNVSLSPSCPDFTTSRRSVYFSYGEITVTDEYIWGLVKDPLIAPENSGYGLDAWRVYIGLGSRIISSGYRNPHKNATQTPPGAQNSRHMYGDAADLRNQSGTDDEYWTMYNAGYSAGGDFIEEPSGPCAMVCTHTDWRLHGGGYR